MQKNKKEIIEEKINILRENNKYKTIIFGQTGSVATIKGK
jgi:hypothetical protein